MFINEAPQNGGARIAKGVTVLEAPNDVYLCAGRLALQYIRDAPTKSRSPLGVFYTSFCKMSAFSC